METRPSPLLSFPVLPASSYLCISTRVRRSSPMQISFACLMHFRCLPELSECRSQGTGKFRPRTCRGNTGDVLRRETNDLARRKTGLIDEVIFLFFRESAGNSAECVHRCAEYLPEVQGLSGIRGGSSVIEQLRFANREAYETRKRIRE